MLKHKKTGLRFTALLLCIFLIIPIFSSCRGGSTQKSVAWLLSSAPRNLDPQTAENESELIVIKNCFSGLFEKSEGGELVSSFVKHYDVSENGLEYTFYLYDDIYWSIYEDRQIKKYAPIIADDFVFAIERLFTDNPDADVMAILKSIKNADKVLNGEKISKLGVKVINDTAFKIALSNKNSSFIDAFTNHALFPCNREFFKSTSGRYGLSFDTMIFNGSFYLKAWGESSLKLEKNKYSAFEPKIDAVTLYMPKDTREHIALLKSGDIDAALLSSQQFSSLDASLFNAEKFTSTLWAMVFNKESALWKSKNLRDAIINATDRSKITLGEHLTSANQLISPSSLVFSENYRKLAGDVTYPAFSQSKAKQLYSSALTELAIPEILNTEILIADDTASRDAFSPLNQIYQRDLPLYFSPQYIQQDALKNRVKSGEFESAVIPLDISANTPSAFLEYFLKSSPQCILPIESENFENAYLDGIYAQSADDAAKSYCAAETELLNSSLILPLYFENSYFVSLKNSSGYEFDFSGTVLFKNVILK